MVLGMKQLLKIVVPSIPLFLSCVDKVDLSLPADNLPIIVQGMITTDPGPDTVPLTQSYLANGSFHDPKGVPGAKLAVTDDTGFTDSLVDIGYGNYVTTLLNGEVGRTYQLSIAFDDGLVAVSTPQQLVSAGTIDTIYYEYISFYNTTTGLNEDGFNIFINSTLDPKSSGRMKWRFLGTYTLTTDPANMFISSMAPDGSISRMPLPCATDCECCECWYSTTETGPILSTPKVSAGNKLDRVFVQYIPITPVTFHQKYRVEIFQSELSEEVFDFFKAIQGQEQNSTSIFQPHFFKIKGNVSETTGSNRVLGTFSASTIARRHIYIPRIAVPYPLPVALEPGDCRAFGPFASFNQPWYWE